MALQDGEDFEMMSSETTQVRIDGDAVKALLERLVLAEVITEKESQACFKEISFTTIKTARKDSSKKPKFIPPNLKNATPVGVVDMLGGVREKKKDLEKEEEIYKDWLKTQIIDPENAKAEKVQPLIDDDGKPAWALDGSNPNSGSGNGNEGQF